MGLLIKQAPMAIIGASIATALGRLDFATRNVDYIGVMSALFSAESTFVVAACVAAMFCVCVWWCATRHISCKAAVYLLDFSVHRHMDRWVVG